MSSYTVYCALLICCTQVFSVDIPDELYDKHALQCLEKTKIDKKDVENMLDEDLHISVKTEHVRKFFECMTESKIAIKEDGQINRDVMYRDTVNVLLPMMKIKGDLNEIANKILDECMSVTGDDQVDRLVNYHNCLVDAANKLKN